MQSFLGIAWKEYGNYLRSVPEKFILGPLMQGLNDPVHHKDFGLIMNFTSLLIVTNGLLRKKNTCLVVQDKNTSLIPFGL